MYLSITTQGEVLARLDGLAPKLQQALRTKMEALVKEVYEKVEANLSGGLLNQKSGALAESIKYGVEQQGDLLIGYIESDPEPPYAKVHEFGGKGYYMITPSKGTLLKFYWERLGKNVALRSVMHPPAERRAYMASALAEVVGRVAPEFQSVIDEALR